MACFRDRGILVPAGMVKVFASGAAGAAGLGVAAAGGAELADASGFGLSAVCANAIPEIRRNVRSSRIVIPRIVNLLRRPPLALKQRLPRLDGWDACGLAGSYPENLAD